MFLLLFSFIYALLGLDLFGFGCRITVDDRVDMEKGEPPLNNFDTFYESLLTVFVLLTGDHWSIIMLDYYRCVSAPVALVYFLSFILLGQYVLLNLFLAILLQNFDEDSIEKEIQKKILR